MLLINFEIRYLFGYLDNFDNKIKSLYTKSYRLVYRLLFLLSLGFATSGFFCELN